MRTHLPPAWDARRTAARRGSSDTCGELAVCVVRACARSAPSYERPARNSGTRHTAASFRGRRHAEASDEAVPRHRPVAMPVPQPARAPCMFCSYCRCRRGRDELGARWNHDGRCTRAARWCRWRRSTSCEGPLRGLAHRPPRGHPRRPASTWHPNSRPEPCHARGIGSPLPLCWNAGPCAPSCRASGCAGGGSVDPQDLSCCALLHKKRRKTTRRSYLAARGSTTSPATASKHHPLLRLGLGGG